MFLERLHRPVRGVRIVHKTPAPDDQHPVTAQIIPYRRLNDEEVGQVLGQLKDTPGTIVTSALAASEQRSFHNAGFVGREDLHLLRHSLTAIPDPTHPRVSQRAGRRTDTRAVIDIDQRSFDDFWILDRESLMSARKATPTHRYRIATVDRSVAGYAITGRASNSSFLQRLGVDPTHRGRGIGSQLVIDALHWAARCGATNMLVNTQVSNEAAVRLYESLGFVLSSDKLTVLEWQR